jgi:glucose/arabinose dehydrogenase
VNVREERVGARGLAPLDDGATLKAMRPLGILGGLSVLATAVALPLACSSNGNDAGTSSSSGSSGTGTAGTSGGSSGSSGTSGGSSGSSGTSGGGDSGGPPPQAQGDPCRGTSIPTSSAYFPPGWCASVVASDLGTIRQLSFAPNGDLFGVTTDGTIDLFHDDNGDGVFQTAEQHVWAITDGNGNNAHVDAAGGYVYAGSAGGVFRFKYTAGQLTGGAPDAVVVNQPLGGHTYHTTHVYDGYLYVHSGSAGNVTHSSGLAATAYDTQRSLIKRFDLSKFVSGNAFDWSAGEVVTVGLRNGSGFKRNEITKKIYDVVNGLDDLTYGPTPTDVHTDNPGEQVVEIAAGKQYGYPFCFTAQRVFTDGSTGALISPGTQLQNELYANPHDDTWCAANSSPPTTFIQAHSAPLDIVFFDVQPQGALPEDYRGGAFVSLHGSWDRSPTTGYKVVWIPFNADGSAPMPTSTQDTTTFPYKTVFGGGDASGPKDGSWRLSVGDVAENPRPVGVAISPIDGALYVSSDAGGVLYRLGLKK